MQAAMKIKKYEMMSQERKSERKFSKGGPSSGKELESLKLNRYIVQLLEVEGKDLQ